MTPAARRRGRQRFGTAAPAYGSALAGAAAGAGGGGGMTSSGGAEGGAAGGAAEPAAEKAAVWMPAAMLAAPNRMKQPTIVVAPRRTSILPDSIISPTVATETTATLVAAVPSKVPCSHWTAATTAPDPLGSASEGEGE